MLIRGGAIALLASLIAVSACKGSIGDPTGGGAGSSDDGDGCVGCTPEGLEIAQSSRFPRLSHSQWENTVQDLFKLPAASGQSAGFAPDPLSGKLFDNNVVTLEVNSALWADYQRAAEEIATQVTGDDALLSNIVPAALPTEPLEKRDAFLQSFVKRAYRRPVAEAELTRIATVFDQGATHYPAMDPFTAGVRMTIEAVLQSPHFLYRAELATSEQDLVALTDYELASRLSYALWNSMPDDELFAAADRGDLSSADTLGVEIDRLLADERTSQTFRRFFDQLGHGEEYEQLDKSDSLYPTFSTETALGLREELGKFVSHVVDGGGGLSELLLDRTTFVTANTAEIYGIDPSTLSFDASGFAQVELDSSQRAGLLTRAGFLAWRGTSAQPDTILRGVYVAKSVICTPLGDPPDEAAGAMFGDEVTNRQRVEALTGPGTCGASCHGQVINPLGFAFEHYGAAGEWRDMDSGQSIDSTATFNLDGVDASYANAVELSALIAKSPSAHQCFANAWIEFALGRDLVVEDIGFSELVADESVAGAPIRDVLRALLLSDVFRYRRTDPEIGQVGP